MGAWPVIIPIRDREEGSNEALGLLDGNVHHVSLLQAL